MRTDQDESEDQRVQGDWEIGELPLDAVLHNLRVGSVEEQRESAEAVALLAKRSKEYGEYIVESGVVSQLNELLWSSDARSRDHAMKALYYLSTADEIEGPGAISVLVSMIRKGPGRLGFETAVQIVLHLVNLEDPDLAEQLGAEETIPTLVHLMRFKYGNKFGNEAAKAILSLVRSTHNNKVRAASKKVVNNLLGLLTTGSHGNANADQIIEILTVIASREQGRNSIRAAASATIFQHLVKSGSKWQKENAAAILLVVRPEPALKDLNQSEGDNSEIKKSLQPTKIAYMQDYDKDKWERESSEIDDRSVDEEYRDGRISDSPRIPDAFRCPVSLELMKDPVLVATGQTYERACIERWLNAGHRTCPKTQQELSDFSLKPNYRLRSRILAWCQEQGGCQTDLEHSPTFKKRQTSLEEVLGTSQDNNAADELLRELRSRKLREDVRGQILLDLKSVAESTKEQRKYLVEAGVVPLLSGLLADNNDPRTQEKALEVLLILSFDDENKQFIASTETMDQIVRLLKVGAMEMRGTAAATLFSLASADVNKATIGRSGSIPALVQLLQEGSTYAKKIAATALLTLAIYSGNKIRVLKAGIMPHLVKLLGEEEPRLVENVAAILAVLSSTHEGIAATEREEEFMTRLVGMLRNTSSLVQEHGLTIVYNLITKNPGYINELEDLRADMVVRRLCKSNNSTLRAKAKKIVDFVRSQ